MRWAAPYSPAFTSRLAAGPQEPEHRYRPGSVKAVAFRLLGKAGAAGKGTNDIAEALRAAKPERYCNTAAAAATVTTVRGLTACRAARLHRLRCPRRAWSLAGSDAGVLEPFAYHVG